LPTGANHIVRFEHDGGTLVDEAVGEPSAPHLVFLHGWGGSRESLRPIAILFQNTWRVHLLDLPGFGDAPPPPPDWNTARYADLVERYLFDEMGGPAVLVGHSFGGRISIRLAARRPSPARAMVLMGVPGLPLPPFSRLRIRRLGVRLLRKGLVAVQPMTGPQLLDWHTNTFGSKDYLAAGAIRPVFVRVVNEDLTESARAVACPTLLLWGSDDRETSPELAERYQRLMNGHADLEILPHKDHHLYTGTGAHLCALKIRSWLSTHVER
jgi:pimeloyl-ACP methyl ester carboxylesterase